VRDGRSRTEGRKSSGLEAAVEIATQPVFSVGAPRVLFEGPLVRVNPAFPNYDVSPDGRRFIMVKRGDNEAVQRPIHVVLNWRRAAAPHCGGTVSEMPPAGR
jgi:hypothetical protein